MKRTYLTELYKKCAISNSTKTTLIKKQTTLAEIPIYSIRVESKEEHI